MNNKRLFAFLVFIVVFLGVSPQARLVVFEVSSVTAQEATPTPTFVFTRRPTPTPTVTHTPTPTETPQSDYLCSAGTSDGLPCQTDLDCENGACIFSQGVCNGGRNDGDSCTTDSDCSDISCIQTCQSLYGRRSGLCLSVGWTVSRRLLRRERALLLWRQLRSSRVRTKRRLPPPGETRAYVAARVRRFRRRPSAAVGASDGASCAADSDCADGACILAQNVCDGSYRFDIWDSCVSDTDCDPGIHACRRRTCAAEATPKAFPVRAPTSATGRPVCPTGCSASVAYSIASLVSTPPIASTPARLPGVCRTPATPLPDTFLCSGGANDGAVCFGPADCPSGACILAQNVCNGGETDGDSCSASHRLLRRQHVHTFGKGLQRRRLPRRRLPERLAVFGRRELCLDRSLL